MSRNLKSFPAANRPSFSPEDFNRHYRRYSRQPFLDILAYLTGTIPDPVRLQEFANQYPDRWANACSTFAKLAGYSEKMEITGNIHLDVSVMGDAQLMQELEQVEKKLVELSRDDYKELPAPAEEKGG